MLPQRTGIGFDLLSSRPSTFDLRTLYVFFDLLPKLYKRDHLEFLKEMLMTLEILMGPCFLYPPSQSFAPLVSVGAVLGSLYFFGINLVQSFQQMLILLCLEQTSLIPR